MCIWCEQTLCYEFMCCVWFSGAVVVRVPSPVAEKGSVTLSCMTDETVIRWTKGPSQTVIHSGRLRLRSESKELDILKVQKSDEGTYYCYTNNTNGIIHNHHGRMHVIGECTFVYVYVI